jgi:hypothetical protein
MKIFFIMTFMIFLFGLTISCHKDTIQPNTIATEYFPNSVDDYSEYDIHDSTAGYPGKEDGIVKITIVGTKQLLDGNNACIWQYTYPSGIDTNYITKIGDTIKVYDAFRIESINGLQFPLKIYIIPFHNNQRWDGRLLSIDS